MSTAFMLRVSTRMGSSGGGSGDWGSRAGGGAGSWGSGSGSWGNRFSAGSFGDRFGGGRLADVDKTHTGEGGKGPKPGG